ncbi:MAG: hypothetical protein E6Y26_01735 [Staphylococcus warneri]|nr:hypothetical protein [Staphylococcus warneri]
MKETTNDNLQKEKSIIAETLKEIEKKFGKEAVMILGEKPSIIPETFSSGSLTIDRALGING